MYIHQLLRNKVIRDLDLNNPVNRNRSREVTSIVSFERGRSQSGHYSGFRIVRPVNSWRKDQTCPSGLMSMTGPE